MNVRTWLSMYLTRISIENSDSWYGNRVQNMRQKNIHYHCSCYSFFGRLIDHNFWKGSQIIAHSQGKVLNVLALDSKMGRYRVQPLKWRPKLQVIWIIPWFVRGCSGEFQLPDRITWFPPWLWHGYSPTGCFKSSFPAGESKHVRPPNPRHLI